MTLALFVPLLGGFVHTQPLTLRSDNLFGQACGGVGPEALFQVSPRVARDIGRTVEDYFAKTFREPFARSSFVWQWKAREARLNCCRASEYASED